MHSLLLKIKSALNLRSFFDRYLLNRGFRVAVSLVFGLIFNLAYLIFNFISGVLYKSPEFIAVSVYYALILSVRYIILNGHEGECSVSEKLHACQRGGIILLATDALITVMLLCSALSESEKNYSALVLAVLSVHAVFTVIRAGVGIYLGKRDREPIHRAAYSVRMASCAMSAFNLSAAAVSKCIPELSSAEILKLAFCAVVSFAVLFLAFSMMLAKG